ncbi:SDR family NAD(P)-dependent oxidoreductase [Natronorubrum halophilum]|uniref:SDR family NAD(P)-dependent oxidoreductase n=1 Tax=Natronorubrum halophilum TaxID=1702106 RepID=UPI0013CF0096|nr:SDR family NAD(P)-dependent oxidoreductase [Natronorubrum halophilum]
MLKDRVCIICGAGNGLGEETAVAMADHGAKVVVNDLGVDVSGKGSDEKPANETVQRIRDNGGEAIAHFGNVSDINYTQQLIEDTVTRYGRVDSIANFAGVLRDRMIFNMDEEDFDAVIEVHLKGHFSLLHSAAVHWRSKFKENNGFDRQRSFMCVSSGVTAGNPGQANYSAAKAGILGLMRAAALELHQYDVRVNALWPTAMTRMTEDLSWIDMNEKEMGPHHVPGVPVFLASDNATDVTGCTVAIAGGQLSIVSDPERERSLSKDVVAEGRWTAQEVRDRWENLTEDFETTRMTSGW